MNMSISFSPRQHREAPPRSVVLVGHSMGGVVARALFTLPRFSPALVSLILTLASPHQAPPLSLDTQLLGTACGPVQHTHTHTHTQVRCG